MYGMSVYDFPYHTGTKINYDIRFSLECSNLTDGSSIMLLIFMSLNKYQMVIIWVLFQIIRLGPIPQGELDFYLSML